MTTKYENATELNKNYQTLQQLLSRCCSMMINRLDQVRDNGQTIANKNLIKQINRLQLVKRQLGTDFFETL